MFLYNKHAVYKNMCLKNSKCVLRKTQWKKYLNSAFYFRSLCAYKLVNVVLPETVVKLLLIFLKQYNRKFDHHSVTINTDNHIFDIIGFILDVNKE